MGGKTLGPHYEVIAQDVFGNVTEEKHGGLIKTTREFDPLDGQLTMLQTEVGGGYLQDQRYSWDDVGNLLARSDGGPINSNREDFTYDAMHRLKSSYTNNNLAEAVTLDYNGAGNITRKSDVGDYVYLPSRPHAVTSITGTGETFTYDANGNQTSTYDTGQAVTTRLLKYTHYDMVSRIERNGHTSTFEYGPDRSRYRRVDDNPDPVNGGLTETLYLGNVEKVTQPDGTVEFKRRIGNALIVVSQDGTRDITYLMKDHLGSSNLLLEDDGSVRDGYTFDPWGNRRGVSDWDQALSLYDFMLLDSGTTNRGYTGHEMVDRMGIIHMNGRIYDPHLGRFLQADPFVDGATNTQGYNRYSYVHNNPLNATDPSGYFSLRELVAPIVAIAGAAICGAPCAQVGWQAVALGATAGGAGAAANGGNILQGMVMGGISAAAFSAIGGHFSELSANGGMGPPAPGVYEFGGNFLTAGQIAGQIGAHAMAGGVMTTLQGGKFGHGFISAGFTKGAMGSTPGMSVARGSFSGRVISYAIVGGTASTLTGGKFANGASTATFQVLFNEMSSWTVRHSKSITNGLRAMAAEGRMAAGGLQVAAGKSLCAIGGCGIGGPLIAQGIGNIGGGVSDYLSIFGVESNYNVTQNLYEYLAPGYGEEIFLGVDIATGVLSLGTGFQMVPVQVEYNLGITGIKHVPAFMVDGTPIPALVNDALQVGKSAADMGQ